LELETLTAYTTDTNCIAQKDTNRLYIQVPATSQKLAAFSTPLDLTDYSLFRAVVASQYAVGAYLDVYAATPTSPSQATLAELTINLGSYQPSPYSDLVLDISSINQTAYVAFTTMNGSGATLKYCDLNEWWLE